MNIAEKLLGIREKIEKAQTKKDQEEGKLEAYKEELLSKHKCKTLKQAQSKLDKLNDTIEKNDGKLELAITLLEEEIEECEA